MLAAEFCFMTTGSIAIGSSSVNNAAALSEKLEYVCVNALDEKGPGRKLENDDELQAGAYWKKVIMDRGKRSPASRAREKRRKKSASHS